MFPDFLIIGAQKAATTYVQTCLSEHPDVFIPEDEVPFFENPDYEQQSIESFQRLFQPGATHKTRGLKRPSYLHKPECPERIYRHIPAAKLIVVLRDYIDRTLSAYYHHAWYGFAPLQSINQGLPGIIAGAYSRSYPRAAEIIDFGFYHEHLQRYLQWFDRDQLLVVLQEDIQKHPAETLSRIQQFIGIPADHIPASLHTSANVTVYSLPRIRMRRFMNPLIFHYTPDRMRLHRYGNLHWPRRLMYAALNRFDKRVLASVFPNKKPSLSDEVIQTLSSLYKEDALQLEQFLGRSLRHWKVFI